MDTYSKPHNDAVTGHGDQPRTRHAFHAAYNWPLTGQWSAVPKCVSIHGPYARWNDKSICIPPQYGAHGSRHEPS
jgi:hypothetical protein